MDANILTGLNFMDWLRDLRIAVKAEKLAHVLIKLLPQSPAADAYEIVQKAY